MKSQKSYATKFGLSVIIMMILIASSLGVISSCSQMGTQKDVDITLPKTQDASAAFLEMSEKHASKILKLSPEWATQLGVSEQIGGKGYASKLSNYTFSGIARTYELNASLLTELNTVDRTQLSGTSLVTYDVMKNAYQIAARHNAHKIGYGAVMGAAPPYVIDQLFGVHINLPQLFSSQQSITSEQEMVVYIDRLKKLSKAMDDVALTAETDAQHGHAPPAFALESIVKSVRIFTGGEIINNPIITSFAEKITTIDGVSNDDKRRMNNQMIGMLTTEIYPAFNDFADRIEALIPLAGADAGIWRVKGGADLYEIALSNYGANGLNADEIHQIGVNDVKRIHGEMDAILRARGYVEDHIGVRMTALAKDPKVLYPNTDEGRQEILDDLTSYVNDVIKIAPKWFGTLPPQAVEVKRIPIYQQDSSAGAYYWPPSLDGTKPGTFWINLKNTADWPKYSLKTLVYHEGVPGHHFQASLQLDVKDMPLIRNMMYFSEYGEGWALYAEELAVDMGLYENDPLGNLGRLKMELYRAARLVVDTGLHAKKWTREQAIDYMVDVTGEPREGIVREIDRYAVWPGQATSYKLGMIRFQKLRAKAEVELRSKFDVKKFHDAVLLDGSMPMPVLEARMDKWIEIEKLTK